MSHAPSSESLARDSQAESKLNLPAFNNDKAPILHQEEGVEEDIYEDDEGFDSSRAPGDPKVEIEKFEGGTKE